MKLTRAAVALMLVGSLSVTACDDEEDDGLNISVFAGTWTSNTITYTRVADQSHVVPAHAVGAKLDLVITAGGDFTGNLRLPHPSTGQLVDIPLAGEISFAGEGEVDVDFQPDNQAIEDFTATYQLSGNNLTFTNPDATFTFPQAGTGQAEAAVAVITMTRTSTSTN